MIVGIGGFAVSKAKGPTGMWTPAALGANLGNWYDAADAGTFTLSGTSITQWNDKSGNNRHATQSVAANKPTYTANSLNGQAVVTFDGSNDSFSVPAFTGSRIQSTLVVFKTSNAALNQHILDESNSLAYGGGLYVRIVNTGKCRYWAQDANPVTDTTTSLTAGDYCILGGVEATSSRSIIFNGTVETTVVPSFTARTTANPSIGTSVLFGLPFVGSIAEIIIVNTNLSTLNRQKTEGYLAWKWGLTSKLPVGHPYKTVPPIV